MTGTVAVTDWGWYQHLSRRAFAEVNFWTPSDRRGFSAPVFSPFFFKLKAPHNAVCGFGYFARYASLPDWLAWDCFGEGNGVSSFAEMQRRIGGIRERIRYEAKPGLSNIGCIVVVEPTFFAPEAWIPQPESWHPRIVSFKRFDLRLGEGKALWDACVERAATMQPIQQVPTVSLVEEDGDRYGTPRLASPRLGQGAFRVAVTDAYDRACALTGEHSLPALDAAHVRPYSAQGPHAVSNGILLRADLHRLFDLGYLTVTPAYRVEVSERLRADYSNGRSYYPHHGRSIALPQAVQDRPGADFLRWHNEHVYLG
jgi:putative restriction endonuclease